MLYLLTYPFLVYCLLIKSKCSYSYAMTDCSRIKQALVLLSVYQLQ